jgi:hypothetical protein
MESALPLLLFFACLIGFTLLILIFGYQNIEEERAREREESAREELRHASPFLAPPARNLSPRPAAGEALVDNVEQYLQDEHACAEEFVAEPSVERLLVHSKWTLLPNDALFERVEQHLSRERKLAEEFVADPSVERLYDRRPELVAAI